MPVGDKSCTLDEDRSRGAERLERKFSLADKLSQSRFCRRHAQHAHHRRFARHGVLAGRFADQSRIAFDVEQVIGDLERLADCRPVTLERGALRSICRGQNAAGLAGKAQQRAGLHRL